MRALKTPKWSSEVTNTDALLEFSLPPPAMCPIPHGKRIFDVEKFLTISGYFRLRLYGMFARSNGNQRASLLLANPKWGKLPV
jgi:hypothetical protein